MAGIEDLIEVWRGQKVNLNPFKQRSSSLMNALGKLLAGRYATTNPSVASKYATGLQQYLSKNFPNVVKKVKITPKEFKIGQDLFRKIIEKGGGSMSGWNLPVKEGFNILSKKNKDKLKVDVLKTFLSNAKALTPLAAKGLTFLTSLPVVTLTMVLQSTPANSDEVNMQLEDFANLAQGDVNVDKAFPVRSKDI
jgi:hypothetical protein